MTTEGRDMSELNKTVEQEAKQAREQEQAISPLVDIFEDTTGITVQADLPGVSKENLFIHIEGDALTIEGKIDLAMPKGMSAIYADVQSTRYQRSFSLSRELDGEKAEASLKDGILNLRIPKREEHKPRKIEVRVL